MTFVLIEGKIVMDSREPLGIILIALYSGFCGMVLLPTGCTSMLESPTPETGAAAVLFGIFFVVFGILLLAATKNIVDPSRMGAFA